MDGAARRVRGQARTGGDLVASRRGKGFPFCPQVQVKVQPHGLLGASNSPSASLSGSGGSLLDVHVRGLCGCGHRGIYGLSVTLGISKDMIPFFFLY